MSSSTWLQYTSPPREEHDELPLVRPGSTYQVLHNYNDLNIYLHSMIINMFQSGNTRLCMVPYSQFYTLQKAGLHKDMPKPASRLHQSSTELSTLHPSSSSTSPRSHQSSTQLSTLHHSSSSTFPASHLAHHPAHRPHHISHQLAHFYHLPYLCSQFPSPLHLVIYNILW